MKRMENVQIVKRVYIEESAGSSSAGRLLSRWIDMVRCCLRKRGLDVMQARRMVQDRCEWQGWVKGSAWGVAQGLSP